MIDDGSPLEIKPQDPAAQSAATPASLGSSPAESFQSSTLVKVVPYSNQESARKGFHGWVDTINKLFQIAALIVAGVWGWSIFQQTVRPGLEAKFPVDTDIHWTRIPNSKVCRAQVEITIKNQGQAPFDIDDVKLSGWIIDLEKEHLLAANPGAPAYFDPAHLIKKDVPSCGGKSDAAAVPESASQQVPEGAIATIAPFDAGNSESIRRDVVDHFAPGTDASSSAQFFFKEQANTLVVFRADVKGTRASSLLPFATSVCFTNYSYLVDPVCGAPAEPLTDKQRSPVKGPR